MKTHLAKNTIKATFVFGILFFSKLALAQNVIPHFDRVKETFLTSSKPHNSANGMRAGRCYREFDKRTVGVDLAIYRDKEQDRRYAVMVARRYGSGHKYDGRVRSENLNDPMKLSKRSPKLIDKVAEITAREDVAQNFVVHSKPNEVFTINTLKNPVAERGDRYIYRVSPRGKLTAQISRTSGVVEYCEFGKILRN